MTCLDDSTVAAILDGTLGAEDRTSAESHLAACALCRTLVAELARLRFSSSSSPPPAAWSTETSQADDRALPSADLALGRYRVLECIGAGAMGLVFAAIDPDLDRKVALKILHPDPARASGEAPARLLREARVMARLSHPNVCAVYDVGARGGLAFVALEHVEGKNLRQWLAAQSGELRWPAVRDILVQAARGMVAAHDVGIVHRDLKPDNILVRDDGRVCVSDFGLACVDDERAGASVAPKRGGIFAARADSTAPRGARLAGTPAYMAPELESGVADALSDQFSFCATAYEALYGALPFAGTTAAEMAAQARKGALREVPKGRHVPGWLHAIVIRGLRPNPSERYPSMRALLAALTADTRPKASRRAWIPVLGASVLLLVTALMVRGSKTVDAPDTCSRGGDRLAGVWDEAQERAVAKAFLATGKPYARDAATAVGRAFARYREEWLASYRGTCEATQRGEQSAELRDLKMACLDRRREDWKARSELLASADDDLVRKSAAVAFDLTPIAACGDVAALTERVPLPRDAAVREALAAIDAELGRAAVLASAGRYVEALPIARGAAERARAAAYRPTEAQALYQLGVLLERTGDPKGAATTLGDAAHAAEAGRADDVLARIRVSLVWVTGFALSRSDDLDRLVGDARATIERLGKDSGGDALAATLLSQVGTIQNKRLGRYVDAARSMGQALAIRERILSPDDPLIAATLNNLGNVFQTMGHLGEARERHLRALGIRQRALGPSHPDVAVSMGNIANVALAAGKCVEASAGYERARAILEPSVGKGSTDVATLLSNYGESLVECDRNTEALEAQLESLAIREHALGPKHPDVASALAEVAAVHSKLGRNDEAVAELTRAEEIVSGALGTSHPSFATAENVFGEVLVARGDFAAAEPHYRAALAIWEKALGKEHARLSAPLTGLGKVALGRHDAKAARGYLERALSVSTAAATTPMDRATTRFLLAQAIAEEGDDPSGAAAAAVAGGEAAKAELVGAEGGRAEAAAIQAWLAARAK